MQRTGLTIFAFMLFGAGLAHLGYLANDRNYRPTVLILLTMVALNDVFAFTFGKLIGGRKLLPATSPNKTVSGAVGALLATSVLVALIASTIFTGTLLDHWVLLLGLGAIVSIGGQAGDLMLSSIKRDLGIKDIGRRHTRPWRAAGPLQLPIAGCPGRVPLHQLLRRRRAGSTRADLHRMTDWQLRPARDHGLTLRQRLRSFGSEPGLGGHLLGFLWRGLVRFYLAAVYRLTVTGCEHLPGPPFVLVTNDSSHLDALTLASALPYRLARRAFAAYATNALPVWRKDTTGADIDLWRVRLLEDKAVLILFLLPEGTRSRTGAMARFRPGIGTMVAGHPIPVVPCFLAGAHAAWPPERRLPRPGRLHFAIGPALHLTDAPADRAGTIAVAAACEVAVRALALPAA